MESNFVTWNVGQISSLHCKKCLHGCHATNEQKFDSWHFPHSSSVSLRMALKKSGRFQAYFKLIMCVLPNLASLVFQISQHRINSPPNRLTVTLRPKFLINVY